MHGSAEAAFWPLALAWWTMTAVMMLPVTWPWFRTLHRLSGSGDGVSGASPAPLVAAFAVGYLAVWLGFGALAAGVQATLLLPHGAGSGPLRAGVLAAAGLYQLTPAKEACLRRCRSPLSVLLARWPFRAGDALGAGLAHGAVCLGCCWALMLLGTGVGAVGWAWMTALTALVAVEKLTPVGPRVARLSGFALIALAAVEAAA